MIRSPARYRWTTAPATPPHTGTDLDIVSDSHVGIHFRDCNDELDGSESLEVLGSQPKVGDIDTHTDGDQDQGPKVICRGRGRIGSFQRKSHMK